MQDEPGDAKTMLLSPWDGSPIGRIPSVDESLAKAAVAQARAAQPQWAQLPFAERARLLLLARDRFASQAEAMVDLLVRENGKPPVEAWYAEILPNVELFNFWAAHTEKLLRSQRVPLSLTKFPGKKAVVHQTPKGVIGIISTWNYPVAISLRAIIPALMAGNAVVFKPATDALLVGQLLSMCFTEVLPPGVFVPCLGPGAMGSIMIESGIDHLVFIGSVETGRQVAALAGKHLLSCSLELGGKDAAIVFADAELDRAVEGIAWGAFTNCGQNCASIERLLLADSIAEAFLERLVERTKALRVNPGAPDNSDMGPLRNAEQLGVVETQLQEALSQGAKLLCGGKRVGKGFGFLPTILDQVNDQMAVWRDETFGPLLPVRRFGDSAQAVSMANQNRYGLTNSLWTCDRAMAGRLARQLHCGVVTVNNHAMSAGIPNIPWGGVRESGLGSTNSHFALREMVRPQVVLFDKPKGHEPWWYPYDAINLGLAKKLLVFLTQKKGMLGVLKGMRRASKSRYSS